MSLAIPALVSRQPFLNAATSQPPYSRFWSVSITPRSSRYKAFTAMGNTMASASDAL